MFRLISSSQPASDIQWIQREWDGDGDGHHGLPRPHRMSPGGSSECHWFGIEDRRANCKITNDNSACARAKRELFIHNK